MDKGERALRRMMAEQRILKFLEDKGDSSINKISKELPMPRTTLIYYLHILESRKLIFKESHPELSGAPNIIKLNLKLYNEINNNLNSKLKDHYNNLLTSQISLRILRKISPQTKIDLEKLMLEFKGNINVDFVQSINALIDLGYISLDLIITQKGKELLNSQGAKPDNDSVSDGTTKTGDEVSTT